MAITQRFTKGEVILVEGTDGDRTFKIRSGEVLICKNNRQGRLVPIAKLATGEMFGEMYLLNDKKSRTASAIAATDVVVEVIFQDEMESHLAKASPGLKFLLKTLHERLKSTSQEYTAFCQPHLQKYNFKRIYSD